MENLQRAKIALMIDSPVPLSKVCMGAILNEALTGRFHPFAKARSVPVIFTKVMIIPGSDH